MRIYAQEWQRLYPFPEVINNTLYSVDFVDENFGWAVGQWGIIMHTMDGGQNWEIQQNHTQHWDLLSVDFVDRQTGWAVGEYGTILYTNDGGETWTNQDVPDLYYYYYDVQFLDDKLGWILPAHDSFILKTEDGGKTWNVVDILVENLTDPIFKSIFMLNKKEGWIVGSSDSGLIIHSKDGGNTWSRQESGIEYGLSDVIFVDSLNGWTCGNKTLRTTDGGSTWDIVFEDPNDVLSAISSIECWIMDSDVIDGPFGHKIKKTINGGNSWQDLNCSVEKWLEDILFINGLKGWCVGANGIIIFSEDGGNNWEIQHEGIRGFSLDGTFSSKEVGWMTASTFDQTSRPLYRSTDGGNSWNVYIDEGYVLFNVPFFCDSLHGWISGTKSTLKRTQDGGVTWQDLSMPLEVSLTHYYFIDSQIGYGTGETRAPLLKTENGGLSWKLIYNDQEFGYLRIFDIFFSDENHGWIITESRNLDVGEIWNTEDGGITWESNKTDIVSAIDFIDNDYGMWVGAYIFGNGVVNKTIDGGITWVGDEIDAPWLNDVELLSREASWIIGMYGYIARSIDGGNTWREFFTNTHADLNSICFTKDEQVGFVFGRDNVLYKYDIRVNKIRQFYSSKVPNRVSLLSNYPNPFNIGTTIEFQVLQPSMVTIEIYNLLGIKIRLLENRKFSPGNYTSFWDGFNDEGFQVSSGLYIVTYRTHYFEKSIKIFLLK